MSHETQDATLAPGSSLAQRSRTSDGDAAQIDSAIEEAGQAPAGPRPRLRRSRASARPSGLPRQRQREAVALATEGERGRTAPRRQIETGGRAHPDVPSLIGRRHDGERAISAHRAHGHLL